jgi:hypothetical protein
MLARDCIYAYATTGGTRPYFLELLRFELFSVSNWIRDLSRVSY